MHKKRILAVIVNYGSEQLGYLKKMISNLNSFQKYEVDIIVNSNIELSLTGVSCVNIFELEDYQLLPLTCRKTIWENRLDYDLFFYSENDLCIEENHFDKFLEYDKILPKNKIAGLIRYEQDETGKYFPDYHADFDWNYKKIEIFRDKLFAHFSNLHQACFILTRNQLMQVSRRFNFCELVNQQEPFIRKVKRKILEKIGYRPTKYTQYDIMCQVCTDVYRYGGFKKVICISDFEANLIHHMPNIYIEGAAGRKKQRSDEKRMDAALERLLLKKR